MLATTIEQSKHLLELGLKAETADMYWKRGYLDMHQESDDELHGLIEPIDFNEHLLSFVPAWSLGALYLLLYRCGGTATDTPHLCEDVPGQGWYFRCYGMNYETASFPTMVEAAYDYVVWLLENKHYRFDNERYLRKNKDD